MYPKPIGPTAHSIIDYAFVSANALAPTLLGLEGSAKALCYGFAATTGVINALTDTPVGLKKAIPLRIHGKLETPILPAILALPLLTGAFKQRNARLYFGAFFALAVTNYLLTDYNAHEPQKSLPGGQELAEAALAELA